MATEQLAKSDWKTYFDDVSRALADKQAEIEVNSLTFGSQMEAHWSPLLGITYDPRSDVLEVIVEGTDHLIFHPRAVFVERDGAELKSLQVTDDDDTRQIIRLRQAQAPSG